MYQKGFDNNKYLELQSKHIKERIDKFGGKLYLEFGGKLFDDYHAQRTLPGFEADIKIKLLRQLKNDAEIIVAINANDIEKNKQRKDLGITYDSDVLRLIDAFRDMDLYVGGVVITQYAMQETADTFKTYLESLGVKTYLHYTIPDYPTDIKLIVSEDGYGKNQFIETKRPLVIVTAPGGGSGKMSVCLSQLYHENKKGGKAGYAKFETFPIWNLPLKHPVNLAYEAATADLNDVNMIDPFHLESYGITAVNYNRDVEVFPLLSVMFEKILGKTPYESPTDMGVNMAGYCITDDEVCRKAAKQEILRRYYKTLCDFKVGKALKSTLQKVEIIMNQADVSEDDRPVIKKALEKSEETSSPSVALQLPDGKIVTGKTSDLLGASSAALLNGLKHLAGINDKIHLISPIVIEPIQRLKTGFLGNRNPRLHMDETLLTLSISAATNPMAKLILDQLPKLKNSEAHSTVILSQVDENVFNKLGINFTCEAQHESKRLYHKG